MRRRTAAGLGAAGLAIALAGYLAWRPPDEPRRTPPAAPIPAAAPEASAPHRAPDSPATVEEAATPGVETGERVVPVPEAMRVFLRAALDEHLPELKLSSDEIDRAAEALLRLRATREELRTLAPTPENADRLAALHEELGRAVDDFTYVVEMSPAEFTARVQPGMGIDSGSDEMVDPPDAETSPPEYLMDLPPRE